MQITSQEAIALLNSWMGERALIKGSLFSPDHRNVAIVVGHLYASKNGDVVLSAQPPGEIPQTSNILFRLDRVLLLETNTADWAAREALGFSHPDLKKQEIEFLTHGGELLLSVFWEDGALLTLGGQQSANA